MSAAFEIGEPQGSFRHRVPAPDDPLEFQKAPFLLRAAVRWNLVELGEMTVEEAFEDLIPAFEACANDSFDDLVEALASQRKVEHPSITRVRHLLENDASVEGVYAELNDPRNHPTPQVVVEAIWHCVRERGVAALEEPANIERLSRCDDPAKALINQRIAKLKGASTS